MSWRPPPMSRRSRRWRMPCGLAPPRRRGLPGLRQLLLPDQHASGGASVRRRRGRLRAHGERDAAGPLFRDGRHQPAAGATRARRVRHRGGGRGGGRRHPQRARQRHRQLHLPGGRGPPCAARADPPGCARLRRRRRSASGRLSPEGAERARRDGPRAHRLRLLQSVHARARRRRSRPARLSSGVGAARRHVPANATHRGRRPAPSRVMKTFLTRRLLQSLVVLLGVSFVVFFILFLTGDPALVLLPPEASAEDIRQFRERMGFNDPFLVQYGRFLGGALRGNFGDSIRHGEPAFQLVVERMPATFELAGAALLIALCLAIPAGIVSAVRRNTVLDYVSTVVALLGQSMPTFWLGIMLILLFSVQLQWLPSSGRGELRHLILPAITLGLFTTARITRLTRSGMLEVLSQDYIRTARAKGVSDPPVVWKHALKNAAIPIVTIVGIELGTLLGGSVITETIFAWPGVGRLSVQAIYNRDYPVVQAAVFLLATTFVLVNVVVDVLYTYLDPRIRLR